MIIMLQFEFNQIYSFWKNNKKKFIYQYGLLLKLDFMVAAILDLQSRKKSINFLENHIKNIPTMEQFHHICSFRDKDLWNLSQSKSILGPSSHVVFQNEAEII
jgi:hypothetical protein